MHVKKASFSREYICKKENTISKTGLRTDNALLSTLPCQTENEDYVSDLGNYTIYKHVVYIMYSNYNKYNCESFSIQFTCYINYILAYSSLQPKFVNSKHITQLR